MKRATSALGGRLVAAIPAGLRKRLAPTARYADMLFLDHLFIRIFFPNRHRLAADAWRAAQPLPYQLRDLARRGIRTIVNLRGEVGTSTYLLEKEACRRLGLTLVDFRIRSRAAPERAEILAARDLFMNIEYPMLMHCKSGADRAGLMSALFLHVREGVPIEAARRQLSLRFGHIRQADTGVLDHFFERYLMDCAKTPMPFFEWVETVYDAADVKRSFQAQGWANRLVDSVLRRE